ncbi:MAG: phospholipase D-like domain-containing protein [Myxococcota bacterium]
MTILFSVLALMACGPDRTVSALPELASGRADADAVDVWFTPDDDVLPIELGAIQRVVSELRSTPDADPADFGIRYGVYNLRNPDIVAALVSAHSAGVPVQILIDADQLDPERDYNQADETLIAAGFSFAPDHRELTVEEAHATELVGIAGSGLMHLKTRLFRTPSGTELLTGSLNPGDNALFNDETLHRIRDPRLVAAYDQALDAVLEDRDIDNAWEDAAPVNVLFGPHESGPSAGQRLFDWIAAEDEQILITAYSLRDFTAPGYGASLVELLGQKVAQGVPVVVITDQKQSDAWGDRTEDDLRDLGVRVYEASNLTTEFTAMHAKSVVLGRTRIRVVTDTANLTAAGFGTATRTARNVESTLFLEPEVSGGALGRRYLAQFLRVLDRYAWQTEDGDAPYAEVEAELLAQPGWPTVDVTFGATAYTVYGETLHVTGDRPELGAWGTLGWGAPLATDPAIYPSWASDPVSMPLGARVAWKLVAVDPASGAAEPAVRWEAGDDRVDHLVPDPSGDTALTATWR